MGVEFGSYLIKVEDKIIRLQIWDTVGQESFRSITKVFYRGAHAVLLCYSMGDLTSFENLKKWMDEIRMLSSSDVLVYLVGTKSDLPDKQK